MGEDDTADDKTATWKEMVQFWTNLGNLSEQRKAELQAQQNSYIENSQHQMCLKRKNKIVRTSPIVRFMLDNIRKTYSTFDAADIACLHCEPLLAGGFDPDRGEIMLCQNRIGSRKLMEATMAHEMIHIYDQARFNTDWNNLRHHACTEIRAASLSGECRWMSEFFGGLYTDFIKHHQACTKRRAVMSVVLNKNCKDEEQARHVVNEVFESCFRDTRPFEEIY